ncbi:MAG: UDP-3-O-acyl-N-acetylglucosamine deacetylase [Alphaproteobacteria bacterium]|nr:UDP-3-O-acyl-N-acetylglucosamine deacetylase [Alphaproteobacteria bacterium]
MTIPTIGQQTQAQIISAKNFTKLNRFTHFTTPHPPIEQTLSQATSFSGIGLHSGLPATVRLVPAPSQSGIIFVRSDLATSPRDPAALIPALYDRVVDTSLCTVLGNGVGATVKTIEHLMAALAVLGIDNLLIEIDGGEIPILDGSCAELLKIIAAAGIATQKSPCRRLVIEKTVSVENQGRRASLAPTKPNQTGLVVDFEIDFSRHIGQQSFSYSLDSSHRAQVEFAKEIAAARTFCLEEDIVKLQAMGFGLGGNLDNAVVIGEAGILNPSGLHYPDEFVRHKVLDAIGDLALAGARIHGHYRGSKAGHQMTHLLLCELFRDPSNYRWLEAEPITSHPEIQVNFA